MVPATSLPHEGEPDWDAIGCGCSGLELGTVAPSAEVCAALEIVVCTTPPELLPPPDGFTGGAAPSLCEPSPDDCTAELHFGTALTTRVNEPEPEPEQLIAEKRRKISHSSAPSTSSEPPAAIEPPAPPAPPPAKAPSERAHSCPHGVPFMRWCTAWRRDRIMISNGKKWLCEHRTSTHTAIPRQLSFSANLRHAATHSRDAPCSPNCPSLLCCYRTAAIQVQRV